MESWNRMVNAALLGTEKKALRKEDVDAAFIQSFEAVERQTSDREEIFLQTAALVYNYRQCGTAPLKKERLSLPVAGAEEKSYASAFAHAVLKETVDSGSSPLLQHWLEQCSAARRIVGPDFLPVLFAAGVKTKTLQPLIKSAGGKRGEWLTQFNEEWQWNEPLNGEEAWHTGTPAQRKSFLAQLRKKAPAEARELLRQTWPQENAATKADLLEALRINAGDEDLPWLEEVAAEKSAKVKAAAERILGLVPSSAKVQGYQNALKQSIRLKTSAGLFGTGAGTLLEIKLSDEAKGVFTAGVEEERDKKISDESFMLTQLIGRVPPRFWEALFLLDRKKIIALFAGEEKYGPFTPALVKAAVRFNDAGWLREVLATDNETFYDAALEALPQAEAEAYAVRFMAEGKNAAGILDRLDAFAAEWSLPFAKAVLRFAARNPYRYNAAFYSNTAHLLPVPVTGELEKCTPKEEHLRNTWSNLSEHIIRLLTLKRQALKAFNDENSNRQSGKRPYG